MKHSFTDEQLLNLVNNTIKNKTEFDVSEFTGGSVQITSTNNHQLMKYKVSLFFGYKQKNPISRTIDINEGLVSIWSDAIHLKCKSMQVSNNGMDYSELNALMNNLHNEVVSNKVVSISSGITTSSNGGSNTLLINTLNNNTIYASLSEKEKELFNEYLDLRKKKKLSNQDSVIKRLLKKYDELKRNPQIIENSIVREYRDFYPINNYGGKKSELLARCTRESEKDYTATEF